VWKTGEVCCGLWWGDMTEREDFKDLRAVGKIKLKYEEKVKAKFIFEHTTKVQRGK
jgi:hypothetical protein